MSDGSQSSAQAATDDAVDTSAGPAASGPAAGGSGGGGAVVNSTTVVASWRSNPYAAFGGGGKIKIDPNCDGTAEQQIAKFVTQLGITSPTIVNIGEPNQNCMFNEHGYNKVFHGQPKDGFKLLVEFAVTLTLNFLLFTDDNTKTTTRVHWSKETLELACNVAHALKWRRVKRENCSGFYRVIDMENGQTLAMGKRKTAGSIKNLVGKAFSHVRKSIDTDNHGYTNAALAKKAKKAKTAGGASASAISSLSSAFVCPLSFEQLQALSASAAAGDAALAPAVDEDGLQINWDLDEDFDIYQRDTDSDSEAEDEEIVRAAADALLLLLLTPPPSLLLLPTLLLLTPTRSPAGQRAGGAAVPARGEPTVVDTELGADAGAAAAATAAAAADAQAAAAAAEPAAADATTLPAGDRALPGLPHQDRDRRGHHVLLVPGPRLRQRALGAGLGAGRLEGTRCCWCWCC